MKNNLKMYGAFYALLLLWTVPANGWMVINPIQLTNGPVQDFEPAFNADGTMIAYRSLYTPYTWYHSDIWVASFTQFPVPVVESPDCEYYPRFKPDNSITFVRGNGETGIWILPPDGSPPHLLIDGPDRPGGGGHDWRPDGQRLAYTNEYQPAAARIWRALADGTPECQMTDQGYNQFYPIYSNSGDKIAYANIATPGAAPHVWVMDDACGGPNKNPLTSGSGEVPMFWWPDDSYIGYETQNKEVWLYNLTSGTSEQLLLPIDQLPAGHLDSRFDLTMGPYGKMWFVWYWQEREQPNFPYGYIWVGEVVPEPATVLLVGLGGLVLRRRKRM